MKLITNNLPSILVIVGALAALWIYFSYFSGGDDASLTSTPVDGSVVVTQELISILGELRNIKIDESIFTDPVFMSLNDFGVVIDNQPVGRRNPFQAIFGSSGATEVVPGAPR